MTTSKPSSPTPGASAAQTANDLGGATLRPIAACYDRRGNPSWTSTMSAPDNSYGLCLMVPDRIIPVIFVPGVMGSNLIQKGAEPDKAITWRLDTAQSAGRWALADRSAEFRKRYLQPDVMQVDGQGAVPTDMPIAAEELRRRGWGEVGALSYQQGLMWLEAALGDYEDPQQGQRVRLMRQTLGAIVGEQPLNQTEVGLSYRYRFPVHACGYNWLASNVQAAQRLAQCIDQTRLRYQREGKMCEQVILVTHSMGGLVARYCAKVLGYEDKIMGVVHGVMPAIGAAAVYRRMKAGTEDNTAWNNVKGALVASALGNDAAEMTAVLSGAPGPLQLLPTPEYGNHWLKFKDGAQEYSLPTAGDPYAEIYTVRGKWWSLCEDHLMNPLNTETNPKKHQAQVDRDWALFENLINKEVLVFHQAISGKYHRHTHAFFGSHEAERSYGTITWTGNGGGWSRGQRPADVLGATPADLTQINEQRTVQARLGGQGWLKAERQTYRISGPDENGDGTVPHRSGLAPWRACASFLQVHVGHEPAYKPDEGPDYLRACQFALRAIVRIAQGVQHTRLKYDE